MIKGNTFQMLLSSRAWLVTCEKWSDRWAGSIVKCHHDVLDASVKVPGESLRGF